MLVKVGYKLDADLAANHIYCLYFANTYPTLLLFEIPFKNVHDTTFLRAEMFEGKVKINIRRISFLKYQTTHKCK